MNQRDVIDLLWDLMIRHEFFADKILPSPTLHNTLIVYVETMSMHALTMIPDEFYGMDVRVHYIGSIDKKYAATAPKSLRDLNDHSLDY